MGVFPSLNSPPRFAPWPIAPAPCSPSAAAPSCAHRRVAAESHRNPSLSGSLRQRACVSGGGREGRLQSEEVSKVFWYFFCFFWFWEKFLDGFLLGLVLLDGSTFVGKGKEMCVFFLVSGGGQ